MKIRTYLMLGWLLGLAVVTGQEAQRDPFAETEAVSEPPHEGPRKPVRLRIETWQAPALEVAKRLDDLHDAAGLAKLRSECLAGAPGVTLISSPVLAIDSGTKELLESITERIYPTEFEPTGLDAIAPEKDGPPKNWEAVVKDALNKAVPTSFETRNTGPTLEAAVYLIEAKEKTWQLRLALEDVNLAGRDTYGELPMGIGMPAFTTFRLSADIFLKEGQWRLASIQEPPRGIEEKRTDVRWITLVRIDADE